MNHFLEKIIDFKGHRGRFSSIAQASRQICTSAWRNPLAQASVNAPLACTTLDQYTKLVEDGLGHLDKSGIADLIFLGRGWE